MESGPTMPGLGPPSKGYKLPNQGKPNVHVPGDVEEVGDTTGMQLALLLQEVQVKGVIVTHII